MKRAKRSEVPKEYRKDYKKIFLEALQMIIVAALFDIFLFWILLS